MQRKLNSILLLTFLVTMASYLPPTRSQRSPYVPMPVNLPGLLPRFGEAENNVAPSGGGGQQSSSSSSSSGGGDTFMPPSSEEDLGARVGERLPSPPRGGGNTQGRCPPQQVPCYECVVYISRTGEITKFSAEQRGRRW